MKPYNIIPPVQLYALNIEAECTCENCPLEYAEYIVEEDGNYYITLNGVRQQQDDLVCAKGDILCMSISPTEVLVGIKKVNKQLEKYNKEYLNNYYFILKESKPLSKTQHNIYLLIHFLFLIVVPIILMDEFIKNPIISLIVFIMYVLCSEYISLFIQKYITNKIFKLIYNGK